MAIRKNPLIKKRYLFLLVVFGLFLLSPVSAQINTSITSPPNGTIQDSDFNVSILDKDGSGNISGKMQIVYLADTSWSFSEEWDTMTNNVNSIESDLESKTGLSVDIYLWGLNNSYPNGASDRVCSTSQTLPDSFSAGAITRPNCREKHSEIDKTTNIEGWVDRGYNSDNSDVPGSKQPSEGWGIGALEVYDNFNWTTENRVMILNADADSNGVEGTTSGCLDSDSQDLAEDVAGIADQENVTIYSLVSDNTECDGVKDQLENVSTGIANYTDPEDITDKIVETVNSRKFSISCDYQIRDGTGGSWTGWMDRECNDSVKVTVDPSGTGADCTEKGTNACSIQVRVSDEKGNKSTDNSSYTIREPTSGDVEIEDNYTDDGWIENSTLVNINCEYQGNPCEKIEWKLNEGGNTVKEANKSTGSTNVRVGENSSGEFILRYRGYHSNASWSVWKSQKIRVDKKNPYTNIIEPKPDAWRESNFTVRVRDGSGEAGLGKMDIYYITDTSGSYFNEWSALTGNAQYIEEQIENKTSIDVEANVWGLNNSYGLAGGVPAICSTGQDNIPGERSCHSKFDEIERFHNLDEYFDLIGSSNLKSNEGPKEAWGSALLEVNSDVNWRPNSYKIVILTADSDSNGAVSPGNGCGDTRSDNLVDELETTYGSNDIMVYSLLGDPECHKGTTKTQMTRINNVSGGEFANYKKADEMPGKIINFLDGFRPSGCSYRIKDGADSWSDWKDRDCPNGNFNVTVGKSGSGFDCTTPGKDKCKVQVKVNDSKNAVFTDQVNVSIGCRPDSYEDINELAEKAGRLKNDKEYCNAGFWRDQDLQKSFCRANTIYGERAVRWFSDSYVQNYPHLVKGGIDDDLTFNRDFPLSSFTPSSTLTSKPEASTWNWATETPVDSGWNNSEVATRGFCAGDDEAEFATTQRCVTDLCQTKNNVIAVSETSGSCVFDGKNPRYDLVDSSKEDRIVYKPGEEIQISIGGSDPNSMACFNGNWYDDWPLSFQKVNKTAKVPTGTTTKFSFDVINIADRRMYYEVSLQQNNMAKYASFLEKDKERFETSIPPKSSKTFTLQIQGGPTGESGDIRVQAEALTAELSNEDSIKVEMIDNQNVGEASSYQIPGIDIIHLLVIALAGASAYVLRY